MCISQNNPLPFFTPEDIGTPDGAIACRRLTTKEQLKIGWRLARLLRYLPI